MLVGGFGLDVAQYHTLRLSQQIAVMAAYAAVATLAMLVRAYPRAAETRGLRAASLAAPLALQFSIGALLSASLVYYWLGGTFSASWPVVILFAGLMVSNEFLREHLLRPAPQLAVFSFALFSLASILGSYLFNAIDPLVFVGAGIVSTAASAVLAVLLCRVAERPKDLPAMLASVLTVCAIMVGAYFSNVIPPIPLAIREAGIYHDVERRDGEYVLSGEGESWLARVLPGQTLHVRPGEPLYAYAAVYAPADLTTTVIHRWQRYDALSRFWVTETTLSYPLSGGRELGYRGFTRTSRLSPGIWRVSVETERGQVLGRIPFVVQEP